MDLPLRPIKIRSETLILWQVNRQFRVYPFSPHRYEENRSGEGHHRRLLATQRIPVHVAYRVSLTTDRRQESCAVRLEAAEPAGDHPPPVDRANGEEQCYESDQLFMSFTKGLPHHPDIGLIHEPQDFVEFRSAIDEGFVDPFSDRVRHGARHEVSGGVVLKVAAPPDNFRQWEAPTGGMVTAWASAPMSSLSSRRWPPVPSRRCAPGNSTTICGCAPRVHRCIPPTPPAMPPWRRPASPSLKAFFDTSAVLALTAADPATGREEAVAFKRPATVDTAIGFRPPALPGPGSGGGVPCR